MSATELDWFVRIIKEHHTLNGQADNVLNLVESAQKEHPSSLVFQYLHDALKSVSENSSNLATFYSSADPFVWFIKGFGNPDLYRDVVQSIAKVYQDTIHEQDSPRLLDIGPGSGLALCGALKEWLSKGDKGIHLDLVEPSTLLLNQCTDQLREMGFTDDSSAPKKSFREFNSTFQEFSAAQTQFKWDVVQSTFCLHNLSPDERTRLLRNLRTDCKTLVLVEFDVPITKTHSFFAEGSIVPSIDEAYCKFVYEKFHKGLQSFQNDGGFESSEELSEQDKSRLSKFVIREFMMRILLDYFNPDPCRATFEVPVSDWEQELSSAGFTSIRKERIHSYWWSDCWMITAQ